MGFTGVTTLLLRGYFTPFMIGIGAHLLPVFGRRKGHFVADILITEHPQDGLKKVFAVGLVNVNVLLKVTRMLRWDLYRIPCHTFYRYTSICTFSLPISRITTNKKTFNIKVQYSKFIIRANICHMIVHYFFQNWFSKKPTNHKLTN